MSRSSKIPVPLERDISRRKEYKSVATQTGISLHNSLSSSSHELAQYASNFDNYYDHHLSSTPRGHKRKSSKSNLIDLSTANNTNTNLNESIEKKKKQSNHIESLNSMSSDNTNRQFSNSIHLHSHDRTLLNYLQQLDLNNENINNENQTPSFHNEPQLPTTSRNAHKQFSPIVLKHFKKRKSTKRYSKRMPKETYNNYDEDAAYFRSLSLEAKQQMLEKVNQRIKSIDDSQSSRSNQNVRRSQRLQLKALEKLNRQKMELTYLIRMDQQESDYQQLQQDVFDVNLKNVTTKRGRNNRGKHESTRIIRVRNIEI